MSGEDRQHCIAGPVSDGNSGISKPPDRRGHAGNDLKAEPCRGQLCRLLAPPPEEKRIAAFKSHNCFPLTGELHQQCIGLLLLQRMLAGGLAGVDLFR